MVAWDNTVRKNSANTQNRLHHELNLVLHFFWFLTHCVIWHSGGTGTYPKTRITDTTRNQTNRLLGTYLYRHYYVAKYVHTDLVILKECSKQLHKIQIQWQPRQHVAVRCVFTLQKL